MARIIECDNLIKIHKQGNLEVVALQGLDCLSNVAAAWVRSRGSPTGAGGHGL